MSDPASTEATTTTSETTDTAQAAVIPAVENVESLPEWARNAITKANGDAAKYRTEKNDAVNTGKAQVTQEYEVKLTEANTAHEKTKADLTVALLENVKLKAALANGIPGESAVEFAALLQGTNEEEIGTHAKTVKALFGKTESTDRATDHSQGSASNALPLNGDPLLAAVKAAVGIR